MAELPPLVFPGTGPPFGDRVREQLLARRTVLLDGPIDLERATLVCAQLMTLDADGDDAVTLIVNSPGGPLDTVFSLLDTIALGGVPGRHERAWARRAAPPSPSWQPAPGTRTAAPMARFSLRLADQAIDARPPGAARRRGRRAAAAARRDRRPPGRRHPPGSPARRPRRRARPDPVGRRSRRLRPRRRHRHQASLNVKLKGATRRRAGPDCAAPTHIEGLMPEFVTNSSQTRSPAARRTSGKTLYGIRQ